MSKVPMGSLARPVDQARFAESEGKELGPKLAEPTIMSMRYADMAAGVLGGERIKDTCCSFCLFRCSSTNCSNSSVVLMTIFDVVATIKTTNDLPYHNVDKDAETTQTSLDSYNRLQRSFVPILKVSQQWSLLE